MAKAGLRSALGSFGENFFDVKAYAAGATRVLLYVLVEVDGAVNYDCPNRKVNHDWNDYLHI
jgi:hypothetical protein